ncbi:procathepsin L-like [Drosophila sulfurigaster albostrigata]|uniref:procathepsin L-like n=1 Tax=Drosophila sulfurigaster albostrigata TaxID=89887 RepID=UPI002D2186FD|nr:procathepsin L-like [Drosophila sulfurigaster albostrigata]XP_062136327.1 procathepsin L-like [Drosophila sulfurigaster albostrigata]
MKAVICILLFALVGFIQARITYDNLLNAEFELFKVEHKKSYDSEYEEQLRLKIFKDNKKLIDRHNKFYVAKKKTYKMGVNKFTDLTPEEFKRLMLPSLNTNHSLEGIDYIYNPSAKKNLPSEVDWRVKGAVNPVKDQGQCGSCWAFSAVGSLESQYFIHKGKSVSLSEQNLMDCSSDDPYDNDGCDGGSPIEALNYVKDNGGIDTESSYPYEETDDDCSYDEDDVGAQISGVSQIESGNEDALADAVANKGPISVCVDASFFQNYEGGVLNEPSCSQDTDHAVVIIGYGTDPADGDYWLVRNSWGEDWGEDGYIRMARNCDNQCGIANSAIYPLV